MHEAVRAPPCMDRTALKLEFGVRFRGPFGVPGKEGKTTREKIQNQSSVVGVGLTSSGSHIFDHIYFF